MGYRNRRKYLIALAVSLDGDFVQFSFGHNSNLGVEVNTKINIKYNELNWNQYYLFIKNNLKIFLNSYLFSNLLSVHDDFWGLDANFWHIVYIY